MKKGILWATVVAWPALALVTLSALASRRMTRRQPPDPMHSPAEYGLPFEEIAFLSRDSIPLRGWFIPAPSSRGTIIFCPGYTGSMDSDLLYAPAFHAHGYNVLMFDFRGHGRSGGNVITMGYHERQDVLAAIEFLGRRGIHRVGLLGFSMGGAVAMSTAPLSPAVQAVVSDGGFARLEALISGSLASKGVPALLATLMGKLIMSMMSLWLGCPLREADPIRWVDKIAPRGLFLIHGARDRLVPTSDVRLLFERAGEPKKLWIEPNAGHRQVDKMAPERYLATILEFFDSFFPP